MSRRLVAVSLAGALLLTATAARATDHPQEAIKVILKQNTATGKAKAVWVSKLPAPVLPALPPTSVGGAFVVTGVDEQASASLPAADWGTNAAGTLYKFVNKLAPSGSSACKVALVKDAKVLKVVCKDSLIQLNDAAQGTVAVALTIGDDTYCSVCTAPLKDEPGKYVAKGCGAPTDCGAAVPPTTTTSTTTSSTTTSTTTLPAQDHFKLYLADGVLSPGVVVHLEDDFIGTYDTTVDLVLGFMAPVVKEPPGIPLINPGNHLTCYYLGTAPFGPQPITVHNQFGEQAIVIADAMLLCVLSDKVLPEDGLIPEPSDHYMCYYATGASVGVTVELTDQFRSEVVSVGAPNFFCNPVDKNYEGILDHTTHLTCYQYTPPGPALGSLVVTINQLGFQQFDPEGCNTLCVPSLEVVPTTTTTSTPSSTATTTIATIGCPTDTAEACFAFVASKPCYNCCANWCYKYDACMMAAWYFDCHGPVTNS